MAKKNMDPRDEYPKAAEKSHGPPEPIIRATINPETDTVMVWLELNPKDILEIPFVVLWKIFKVTRKVKGK